MENKEALFLNLIEENKGILFKISKIYQEDTNDREDLLQEMILQLWLAFDTYRGDSKFSTWMYRVALNTAITFFKKQKRRPDREVLYPDFDQAEESIVGDEKEAQLNVFYRAVQQLGKVEKALIYLYMENIPYNEIAANLGISEGNVRVRIVRLKIKLKEIIKKTDYEY